ncbi:MAG: alpha/beta hydrolase [Actinomycetia bacterium]|nr:alpha/beta hydrolase [Actinomycetes bacterium]MCP5035431.1 alpha/beta hydrolase [Actinomycetes bacterium]
MICEVNGHQAHAATGGVDLANDEERAQWPALILIHGAGMDATVWQLQTRYLAHHGFRTMAVDLPGHGRSEGDPLSTIGEMADWLASFIEVSGEAPAALVGHSMGTFIALEVAARRPDLVSSIVLLGTANAMPVHPDLLTSADQNLPDAAALMASWSLAKPAHIGLNPTPGLWMLGGARALVEVSQAGALVADFGACTSYDGAAAAAAEVSCSVAIGVGAGDKMTPPRAAAKLIEHLTDPTVVELADTGHMMMVENPRAIRKLLLDALQPA